jgi:hypothetical protein
MSNDFNGPPIPIFPTPLGPAKEISCDQECMRQFNGAKGERVGNCEEAFRACCTGIRDAKSVCEQIGRSVGKR